MVDMQLIAILGAVAVFGANYLGSKTNQAKLLKKILKKEHGLIRLHTGKSTISRVINFESDKFVVGDKTYLKTPDAITIEKDGKKDPKLITKDMINMEDGVPVIDFDIDSIMPKTFCEKIEGGDNKIDATPEQITAIFRKERALAKAEAYDSKNDKVQQMLMICCLAAIVAAGLAYFAYDNTNTINTRLNILHNGTQMIGAALNISVP